MTAEFSGRRLRQQHHGAALVGEFDLRVMSHALRWPLAARLKRFWARTVRNIQRRALRPRSDASENIAVDLCPEEVVQGLFVGRLSTAPGEGRADDPAPGLQLADQLR